MSDGIVLVGLPGSGKTAVGRLVAERLDRPFVDVDVEVQRISGSSPAELISRGGEARMRKVESQAVAAAVTTPGAVIATGGGTVLDPLNRWLLMEHGLRVRLDAQADQLAARLRSDPTSRPLLGADLEDGLRRTFEERAPVYAAVDAAVDASTDVEPVADAVLRASREWQAGGWRPLLDATFARQHPMGPRDGRLLMGHGLTASVLTAALNGMGAGVPALMVDRAAISANEGLAAALASVPSERTCVMSGGESAKTMARLEQTLAWMSALNVERNDALVVVGGGTLGDLGGLAAALHRRGVPLVSVPTTWLAQSDSSIGGKVAIDLPRAKNGVGTYWPASLIVDDAAVVGSLPADRRRDGIAECLKAGLIGDPLLWQLVEESGPAAVAGDDGAAAYAITERALRVKLAIVERDPFEAGERRKLNLGHTIGHALEIESGYTLAHGEAVALGLRAVARIAAGRGAQRELPERIDTVLSELGFTERRRFERAAVVAALRGDKKREAGVQRWILPLALGEVAEVTDVSARELDAALDAIAA